MTAALDQADELAAVTDAIAALWTGEPARAVAALDRMPPASLPRLVAVADLLAGYADTASAVHDATRPGVVIPMPAPAPLPPALTAREWRLVIPAPADWLSANGRRDRRAETPDRQAWRNAAKQYARAARLPHLDRAHIAAVLRFRNTGRRRDVHNYYPTLKAVIDGLVDYGLLPDDNDQHLTGPDLRSGPNLPPVAFGNAGELTLTIREITP